jgi:hypothetical protein
MWTKSRPVHAYNIGTRSGLGAYEPGERIASELRVYARGPTPSSGPKPRSAEFGAASCPAPGSGKVLQRLVVALLDPKLPACRNAQSARKTPKVQWTAKNPDLTNQREFTVR